jgi:hypothetical protein
MADRSLRPIENVKPGDSVLSRDEATGRLVPELILFNRHSKVPTTVMLQLSTSVVLGVSPRQPLVLHDGKRMKARDIMKQTRVRAGAGKRSGRSHPKPLRLRPLRRAEVHVMSSQLVIGSRSVHWLETKHKRNIFVGDVEISTDIELKELPV